MQGRSTPFYDLLTQLSDARPELRIFTFLDNSGAERSSLTYQQLLEESMVVASHLRVFGQPRDRVLVLLDDQSDFIITFFACLMTGLVAVPARVPKRNEKADKTLKIITDCQPEVIVGSRKLYERWHAKNSVLSTKKWLYAEELGQQVSDFKAHTTKPADPALIQYTSGTQGEPKGVLISHANVMANSSMIHEAMRTGEHKGFVSWLPHYHDMGLFGSILEPVFRCLPSVFMSPPSFARRPVNWLKAIGKYGATISGGPNFGYQHCVEKIDSEDCAGLDLSNWQTAYCGAEMVRVSTLRAFSEKFSEFGFNPKAFAPCYGMAEATLFISCAPYFRGFEAQHVTTDKSGKARNIVSCGLLSEHGRVRIVKDGHAVDDGVVGEIFYKGPNLSSGYWKKPETNSAFFDQQVGDEAGYFKTGDLGFISAGELYLTGRSKELIIHRGSNFYPQDIEAASSSSNRILTEDGVVAFSQEGATDSLVVLQEVRRSFWKSHDHDSIIREILQNVSEDVGICPSAIALLKPGSLPRTSSGKVSRILAKKHYLDNELGYLAIETFDQSPEVEPLESVVTLQEVQRVIMGLLKASSSLDEGQIVPNTSVFSMGLDSVAAVDLTVAIETRLNISLDASLLWQFETVEEISRYIYDYKICSDDLDSL